MRAVGLSICKHHDGCTLRHFDYVLVVIWAYRIGDLTFSAYSWHALITNRLAVGDALAETQSEAEKGFGEYSRS